MSTVDIVFISAIGGLLLGAGISYWVMMGLVNVQMREDARRHMQAQLAEDKAKLFALRYPMAFQSFQFKQMEALTSRGDLSPERLAEAMVVFDRMTRPSKKCQKCGRPD